MVLVEGRSGLITWKYRALCLLPFYQDLQQYYGTTT